MATANDYRTTAVCFLPLSAIVYLSVFYELERPPQRADWQMRNLWLKKIYGLAVCVMQWKVEVSTKREIIKRENLFLLLFFAIFIWFPWRYRPITTRPSCYPPLLLFPSLSEKSIFSSSSSTIITWTGACRGVWHCWTKYIFYLAVSGAEISSYPPPIPPRRPGTRLSIWQCFLKKNRQSGASYITRYSAAAEATRSMMKRSFSLSLSPLVEWGHPLVDVSLPSSSAFLNAVDLYRGRARCNNTFAFLWDELGCLDPLRALLLPRVMLDISLLWKVH